MALGALVSLCLFLVSSRAASPFCSNPGLPRNGHIIATDYHKVTVSSYEVGDQVLFECNDGHRLVGNRALTCLQIEQGIARWSNKVPLCEKSRTARGAKAACSKPKDIINGAVRLTRGLAVRSMAKYSCSKGFKLSRYGSSTRICLSRGRGWSGTPPFCQKAEKKISKCRHSSRFTNGRVKISKTRHQSIATYSCNSGYKRYGRSVRVCSSRTKGKWSGRLPSCRATGTCLKLSAPSNGDVVTNGLKVGSKATYSCDRGFEQTGDKERTCKTNGRWSGYPPKCRKNCEMLPSPPNGNVYIKGLVVSSYAMYSCHVGYKLEGDKTRQCQYGGTWTKAQPNCKKICRDLSAPKAGSVDVTGLRAEYSCDDGFELVGNKIVTCLNIGRWSGKKPICRIRPKQCIMPHAPSNGQVNVDEGLTVGSKAMYSCDSGFDLIGSQLRECLIIEKWSDREPYCKPEVKTCGKLNSPKNGKVVVRDTELVAGSEAKFKCKRGFVLKGDRKLHCQANGKWAGRAPTCKFVRCKKPGRPRHGHVRATGNVPGSRTRYFCRPGYVFSRRHRVRKCQGNGKWSGRIPSCVLILKDGFKKLGNLFRI